MKAWSPEQLRDGECEMRFAKVDALESWYNCEVKNKNFDASEKF